MHNVLNIAGHYLFFIFSYLDFFILFSLEVEVIFFLYIYIYFLIINKKKPKCNF